MPYSVTSHPLEMVFYIFEVFTFPSKFVVYLLADLAILANLVRLRKS